MDEMVARSLAKWPNVPSVYGWLSLDRRGNWRIRSASATQRFERIGNAALRDFIGRNYQADERGCWLFQNGPQRVYVSLAYTPLVVHYEGERLVDHRERPFAPLQGYLDEEGSVLIAGEGTVALLDDRDLARYADRAEELAPIAKDEVASRFGFVPDPAVSLHRS
ncbi:MAG TPA: DUF2946 family protein [Burkholderiales bacterium]|nr:DUF2946 family protein [Burkholderiales bacterium]